MENLKLVEKSEQAPIPTFDDWYAIYPRKEARKIALTSWGRLNAAQHKKAMDTLPNHVEAWAGKHREFIPFPATWLNQERFDDELQSALLEAKPCSWYGCKKSATKPYGTKNVCEVHLNAFMRGETPNGR